MGITAKLFGELYCALIQIYPLIEKIQKIKNDWENIISGWPTWLLMLSFSVIIETTDIINEATDRYLYIYESIYLFIV